MVNQTRRRAVSILLPSYTAKTDPSTTVFHGRSEELLQSTSYRALQPEWIGNTGRGRPVVRAPLRSGIVVRAAFELMCGLDRKVGTFRLAAFTYREIRSPCASTFSNRRLRTGCAPSPATLT